MITKFKKFYEAYNSKDMMNSLDLGIENDDNKVIAQQGQNKQELRNAATLKITDIKNRITQLTQQKSLINNEIVKLQNAQRDLMPNNPDDPNNAKTQKEFIDDQTEKIKIQQTKLQTLDEEIKNLQKEISRNQQKYM